MKYTSIVVPPTKKRKGKPRKPKPLAEPTLAEATWEFFSRFIHPLHYALGDPSKSPPKHAIERATQYKGYEGCCKYEHHGSLRTLKYLQPYQFQKVIDQEKKLYYVSGETVYVLLYHDIDNHKWFQKSEHAEQGQQLVAEVFGRGSIWQESSRGNCGWSLIDCKGMRYDESEKHLKRFERCVRKMLAQKQCLAEYEIKGLRAHYVDGEHRWPQYGKLPCHKDWSWDKLAEFKKLRKVKIAEIIKWCDHIDTTIPDAVLEHWAQYQRHLERLNFVEAKALLDEINAGIVSDVPMAAVKSTPVKTKKVKEPSEVDSFARQRTALLAYCRQQRRVVSTEEALAHIKQNHLYTGDWAENEQKRSKRVAYTLAWIARTFSAEKCTGPKVKIRLGRWDDWCRRRYPNGLYVEKINRDLTDEGEIIERSKHVGVELAFVQAAMPIMEFLMVTDAKEDGGVPQERAAKLWAKLFDNQQVGVKFSHKKWSVLRELLAAQQVVEIVDRKFWSGKAMCWAPGQHFPKDKHVKRWEPETSDIPAADGELALCATVEQQEQENILNICITTLIARLTDRDRETDPRPPP